MQKHEIPNNIISHHTNAFVRLNGVPYLVSEYLDRQLFRQLDRSLIESKISVDTKGAMRAVVNIGIDDIGKRSNDLPQIVGNHSQQLKLIQNTKQLADKMGHRFDVLKRGIIVRVNYQLENNRTGHVIRSTSEDLRIKDRNYFIDVNPRDIHDNAIVVNFMDSIVSTINQFTHGIDKMIIRITSIQMFYELIKREATRHHDHYMFSDVEDLDPEDDFYNHHKHHQHRHAIGIHGTCNCDDFMDDERNSIFPPSWSMFNRLYHFDNFGKDIVLHFQEINDNSNKVALIPCGTVRVNRSFMINPGHRIIFKISIWKNDLVSIFNTQKLAEAIGLLQSDLCHSFEKPKPPINIDLENIIHLMNKKDKRDDRQNFLISKLIQAVRKLQEDRQDPEVIPEPEEPEITEPDTETDCDCGCDHSDIESMTNKQIEDILEELGVNG